MEQVFELVNILLQRDRASKRRNLSVRTYKVIPLASQAGLLEFVTNTMPIGTWLLNAHKKYIFIFTKYLLLTPLSQVLSE